MQNGLSPNPYISRKSKHAGVNLVSALFLFVKFCYRKSEVVPRTVKLLANARSEVKFAQHFAVRRNFTHEVNFTYEVNFTCPKGKLS